MRTALACASIVALLATRSPCQPPERLEDLYQAHLLFEFRDAVNKMHRPDDVDSGIVACSFNDLPGCELHMGRVLRSHPSEDDAITAHRRLMALYISRGKFRAARAQFEANVKLAEAAGEKAAVQEGFDTWLRTFAGLPEMSVRLFRPSRLSYDLKQSGIRIPVTINGTPRSYLIDTGAGLSIVSESEARRDGMRIAPIPPYEMGGFTGASWKLTKVAISAHMDLGQIRLDNVPFFIADDSTGFDRQMQGILGLQVLLAVGGFRWSSDGVAEFGFQQRGGPNVRVANLVLDDWTILARAEVQGKPMDFYFDTGGGSYLMEPFRQAFPELAKLAKPDQWEVGDFGDPDGKWEVLVLPEVVLKIGNGTALLRPARVVPRPNQRGGLLSPDAFAQARSVTVDLRRMMLVVE